MVDRVRQLGVAGVLLGVPALSIYGTFALSRFFYHGLFPVGGLLIPDSEVAQQALLFGMPFLGLLASIYAYGAARDSISKTGIVLNALVILTTLSFLIFN